MQKLVLLTCMCFLVSQHSFSAEHKVELLNKDKETGERMVFKPSFLKVSVGDTIHFEMKTLGHNVKTLLFPDGAEAINGRMNKPVSYQVTKEGVYLVKCQPHFGMGMIMMFQVGNAINLEQIKKAKILGRKTKERFELMLSKIQAN